MNSLNDSLARFAKLNPRERVLAVVAVAAILYFIVHVSLLAPQQRKLADLARLDKAHQTELAGITKALAELEKDAATGLDQTTKDRATLAALKKQIADAAVFYQQADATTSEIGALVRELVTASPGLTLVGLKTLPVAPFYTPQATGGAAKDAQKPIYKRGIEVSVKGNYMALLAYMEKLQNYPKRLFWSEAKLDVAVPPDAVLKLVIYSLSEQPSSSLR